MILSKKFDKKLRDEVGAMVRDWLAKYVGRENTPELREQVVADLLGLKLGEKKRMTPDDCIRAAIPGADDALCAHIVWGRTPFPAGHARGGVTAREFYKAATHREQQVLTLIVAGNTSKGIGEQLGISHRTVEVHRAIIKAKLGARNSVDLVRIALTRETPPASR